MLSRKHQWYVGAALLFLVGFAGGTSYGNAPYILQGASGYFAYKGYTENQD